MVQDFLAQSTSCVPSRRYLKSCLATSQSMLEIFAVFIVIYPTLSPHCAWGPTVGAVPHVHVLGGSHSP